MVLRDFQLTGRPEELQNHTYWTKGRPKGFAGENRTINDEEKNLWESLDDVFIGNIFISPTVHKIECN